MSTPGCRYRVRWADLDANGHMRNTAYLDYAAETRLAHFAGCGFTADDFRAAGVGPVAVRDVVTYRRELLFQQEFTVELRLAGLSGDGIRMRLENVVRTADGAVAATVLTDGVWFDTATRRPTRPPQPLLDVLLALPRCEPFAELTGPP